MWRLFRSKFKVGDLVVWNPLLSYSDPTMLHTLRLTLSSTPMVVVDRFYTKNREKNLFGLVIEGVMCVVKYQRDNAYYDPDFSETLFGNNCHQAMIHEKNLCLSEDEYFVLRRHLRNEIMEINGLEAKVLGMSSVTHKSDLDIDKEADRICHMLHLPYPTDEFYPMHQHYPNRSVKGR